MEIANAWLTSLSFIHVQVLPESVTSGPFRIESNVCSWILPSGGRKKQGRTVPSASTTAETHGALHFLYGNGFSP